MLAVAFLLPPPKKNYYSGTRKKQWQLNHIFYVIFYNRPQYANIRRNDKSIDSQLWHPYKDTRIHDRGYCRLICVSSG